MEAEPPVDPLARLSRTLAERDDVLILDNCEHVIEAAAAMAALLLGSCPRLRIVATSREPLRTDGECLLPVPPLPFPRLSGAESPAAQSPAAQSPAAGSPAAGSPAAESYASVRLLCDRAAAVRPGFTLDAGNAAAIARVCRALDGMPLAIELAAVWLRVLSVAQLAERLDDRFALLTGGSRTALPRHQTLRAVVDWSWELLSGPERALARRLSLFPAGATLEAAEQVCAGEGLAAADVLPVLSGVVDKSILSAVDAGAGAPRYSMLETVRAYCLERLSAAGEVRRYRDAFSAYYLALAERADPELRGRDQARWMSRLLAEQDNLHAALRWSVSQRDADTAFRLVRALGWFWMLRGQPGEARAMAQDVLALTPPDRSPRIVEAWLICGLTVAGSSWDIESILPDLRGAADALGDLTVAEPTRACHPLAAFGPAVLAFHQREPDRALALFDRYAQTTDPWLRAGVPFFRGMLSGVVGGQMAEAEASCQDALENFRALGDAWGTAAVLIQLADFARLRGDFAAGIAALEEAMSLGGLIGAWGDLAAVGAVLALQRMRVGDLTGARADLDRAIRQSAGQEGAKSEASIWFGTAEVELLWCEGDLDAAMDRSEEVVAMIAAKESPWYAGSTSGLLTRQAMIKLRRGDEGGCRALLAEALRMAADWVERPAVAAVIDAVAALVVRDDPRSAATLLGAASAARGCFDEGSLDAPGARSAARDALGPAGYDEAFRRATGLGLEEGVALAGSSLAARALPSLRAAEVGTHGQRREHDRDAGSPGQRPPGRVGHRPADQQRPGGVGQRCHRVHLDERLQPARHGLGGRQHVAAEHQREIAEEREGLHALGGLDQHADQGRDPAHGQREGQHQQAAEGGRERVVLDPEAEDHAEPEGDGDHDDVPHHVAHDRAGQRCPAGDRQAAEPVEHPGRDVVVQHQAGAEGAEDHRHDQDPGHRRLEVLVRAAGDRAAEDVGEQHQEHDRLEAQAEQVLAVGPDLQHAAPGQRERVPQPGDRAEPPGRDGAGREDGVGDGGHDWLLLPVREKKTSSRLALRRANSASSMPLLSSSRTIPGSSVASATWTVSRSPLSLSCGVARVRLVSTALTSSMRARSAGAASSTWPPVLALSWSGVPVAITVPWSMTTMSFAIWSASSRYWVVSSTVTPSLTSSRTICQTSVRLRGSSPVVGSSR
jgi:predicted ATPase